MKAMPLLINLGKAITLIAWLMMAYNLVMLFKTLLPLTKLDYLHVFIFGIFSLLAYRQKVMTPAS